MNGRRGVVVAGALAALAVVVLAELTTTVVDGDRVQPAVAQGPASTAASRTITVNGHGVVTAEPDTASVWLGVSVTAPRASDALEQASRAAQTLIDTLTGHGVAADDIVTTSVSLWPQYGSSPNRITGYQAGNDVRVTIRDLARAGSVIDAGAAAVGDAARVNGITFTIDDTSTAIAAARAAAMRDAAARAGQYAAAGGVAVGAVVQIGEQQVADPWPVQYAPAAAAGDRASVPLQPGTQQLTVDVTVVYELAG
jgi:uncharacterized protein YggE